MLTFNTPPVGLRRPPALALLIFALSPASADAQTLNTDWWHTSGGQIHSMVPSSDGSVIYMSGSFNYVGPVITYGALLDLDQGQPEMGLPMPNGTVECSISDGSGGWFIGGQFSEVGGQARTKVARIDANGSLNGWQVDVGDGIVYAMLLDGATLYLGGTFVTVGGQARWGIAAVDATTGALLPFAPVLADAFFPRAKTMVVVDNSLVMGGNFESVNGTQRRFLAAVDKVSGELSSWDPNPGNEVFTMALSEDGTMIHVGGSFTSMSGQTRARTAAFNASTFALLPWTVAASNAVRTMSIEAGVLVLGGEFSTLGGLPRENLGAVNAGTAAVLDWVADTDDDVNSVLLHDGVVYVGGRFREIGGLVRRHIAAVDMADAQITDWDPVAGNDVYSVSLGGERIFTGGSYTSIGGKVRNKLMAMDPTTGRPTDWDAHAQNDYGSISELRASPDGQVLYASGSFNEVIGGQQRKHLAALDVNTGLALPWAPLPNDQVTDIELSPDGTVLYACGYFTNMGGVQRRRLAAFNADPQQTQLLPWDPDCTAGSVSTMDLSADGSTLYVGGSFTSGSGTIGGQPRDRLVALSTSINTNNATSWEAPLTGPNAIGTLGVNVYSVLLDPTGGTLYLGGLFNSTAGHAVSGQPRDNVAAVSTATGAVLPWDPGTNDRVSELKWSAHGDLMVCGVFDGADAIGGQERQGFAYVDPISGVVGPFSVTFNSGGYGVDAEEFDDLLILSGYFAEVNGQVRLALAAFDLPPTAISESGEDGWLRAYPVPTSDQVWLPGLPGARSIEIFDQTGRSVLRSGYGPMLHLQGLGEGLYVLVINDVAGRRLGRCRVMLRY